MQTVLSTYHDQGLNCTDEEEEVKRETGIYYPSLLYQSSEQADGDSYVNFDVTSWPAGIHSISFISTYGVVNESFVKQ